jgi:CO/xanthine dehydrogenase FAD-binding subunit
MPAFPEDIEQALREGIRLLPGWGPKQVIESGGVVQGLELVRCTSVFDPDGSFSPRFDPTVTETVVADQVLLAIGQATDLAYAGRRIKTARGLIVIEPETGSTNLEGVFAGGEVTSGPASVIEAIAAGRRAAQAIGSRLAGRPGAEAAQEPQDRPQPLVAVNAPALARSARVCAAETPVAARTLLGEDTATLGLPEVQQEARRCVSCGCIAVNASDLAPALIALGATLQTTRRTVATAEFFDTRTRRTTVLDHDELLVAVNLPPPPLGARQSYLKFRLRRAIDFPIASVAGLIALEGGRIKDARVVLGAVAPVPVQARDVEAFLVGKSPSEETAYAAGQIVARTACILSGNRYKLQIVKGLLRRLILSAPAA